MMITDFRMAALIALPLLIPAAAPPALAKCDDSNCRQEGDFSIDGHGKKHSRARASGGPAGHCRYDTVYVDPGHRYRKGSTFPRIQDAIDAVKPGGTVYIRSRTGSSSRSGGLRGDRGHVFLESLVVRKPMTLAGGNNERDGWGQLSSGPDGRCLTVHVQPGKGRCWFKKDKTEVHVRNLRWEEIFGREPSEAPCIHVQKGTLHLANSSIRWRSNRSAVRVGRAAAAHLRDVSISVSDFPGRAVALYGGRLHIAGGNFTGSPDGAVIFLSGGTWTIDGASISGGRYGLAVTLANNMRGQLSRSSISENYTGLSVGGTGDARSVSAHIRVSNSNEFSNNDYGAYFENVGRASFSGNRLIRNQTGLALERSSGAFRNNLFLNNDIGIRIGRGPKWVPEGSPAHPEISGNQIRGTMRYAVEVMPGGKAAVSGNSIRAPKCRCVSGDLDSGNLLFRRSDCPRDDWGRSCRSQRERWKHEREEEESEGGESPPGEEPPSGEEEPLGR